MKWNEHRIYLYGVDVKKFQDALLEYLFLWYSRSPPFFFSDIICREARNKGMNEPDIYLSWVEIKKS